MKLSAIITRWGKRERKTKKNNEREREKGGRNMVKIDVQEYAFCIAF